MRGKRTFAMLAVLALCGARIAAAQTPAPSGADNYDEQFARYLEEARRAPVDSNWMNGLTQDFRARRLNDLITIRVVENITGSGTADSALGKTTDTSIGVPNLLGIEKKLPSAIDPSNLAKIKADNQFKGSGTTNRAGILTANLTARVSEVLPNGDLVVEGVREIEINGDRQIVVLSGVVRPADIALGNVVPSTAIGQLRIRYFGKGLMKDNLNPGWLARVLNKIF